MSTRRREVTLTRRREVTLERGQRSSLQQRAGVWEQKEEETLLQLEDDGGEKLTSFYLRLISVRWRMMSRFLFYFGRFVLVRHVFCPLPVSDVS